MYVFFVLNYFHLEIFDSITSLPTTRHSESPQENLPILILSIFLFSAVFVHREIHLAKKFQQKK